MQWRWDIFVELLTVCGMNRVLYYSSFFVGLVRWLPIWVILFSLMSCRKDSSPQPQVQIEFQLPGMHQTIGFNQSIPIRFRIQSDQNIGLLRIQIVNAQNEVFLHSVQYSNVGTFKEVNVSIEHNDIYLSEGEYFVRVIAGEGYNQTLAYLPIVLQSAPITLQRLYVFRSSGTSTFLDTLSASGVMPFRSFDYPFQSAAINSRDQWLLMGCANRLLLLDASTAQLMHEQSFGNLSVTTVVCDEPSRTFYSATEDGYLIETNRYGQHAIFSYQPNWNFRHVVCTPNFVIADAINYTQTAHRLWVFNKSTRAVMQFSEVYFELKELMYLNNEDKLLAVGNDEGVGVLKYYNRLTNFFNEVYSSYNTSLVGGAWPTATNRMVVSHQEGLVEYSNYPNMLSQGVSIYPKWMMHEKLSGLNYAINENGVYVLNTNATSLLNYLSVSNGLQILPLYNK